MASIDYIDISLELDQKGLVWHPEIGDEISLRGNDRNVSILVDPGGLTPNELRQSFVWLPTVEQLVSQIEARSGLIFHAGVTELLEYEAIIRVNEGLVEARAASLREALGKVLTSIISARVTVQLH
ncbi:MAG TPA: hypothetical protein PKA63_02345 [Oligoflexia bacterium]|nr:hypothetical protein [Oligoflexia bacterium]HMP47491.1 hypothetical protein [Oligoflexia bacterium]